MARQKQRTEEAPPPTPPTETPKPRRRRDPYDRALNAALKRREKAIQELDKCEKKLQALGEEIPRLEQIIAVLGQKSVIPQAAQETPAKQPLSHPGLPGGVPTHLEKYLRKVIGTPQPGGAVQPAATDEGDDLPTIAGEPVLE